MDNDKGLELSLGLACGVSSSNSKDRSSNSAEATTDTDERTSKIVNDFKNFLSAGMPPSLPVIGSGKRQDNALKNSPLTAPGGNNNGPVQGDKRKSMFDNMNDPKKQETEARSSDMQDKGRTSHISITTEDGSTADNEDVAESEPEGSTSTPIGSGSSSQVPKEIHFGSSPFSAQSMKTLNVPYSITMNGLPSINVPSTSSYPSSGMIQAVASMNGWHRGPLTVSPRKVPMTFGYSPVQLPVLDKDKPWGMVTHPHSLHSPYAGRAISTSVPMQVSGPRSTLAVQPRVHQSEQSKGQPNPPVAEVASSSQSDDDAKRRANPFPSDYPTIKPGIAADVKFGGSGSFPSLPWVSTTGLGPNGKTISGVTYKYSTTQIKIVCACHGTHMSPEEFILHATTEPPSAVTVPSVASLSSRNPAASATS